MKYGQALYDRSVAQWAAYNIDYNELKDYVKQHTTKGQAQAVAIPGQPDEALQRFEDFFCDQLRQQHERVDLFVKSKAAEFKRRLTDYEEKLNKLIVKTGNDGLTIRRSERFSRLETRIMRCGEEIRNLDRFVQAQTIGFRKILKKYRKWTGSSNLTPRTDEFLASSKSFTKMDFDPLYTQYTKLIDYVREHSPIVSELSTPTTRSQGTRSSRSPSRGRNGSRSGLGNGVKQKVERQGYWNEYDNPSEEEEGEGHYVVYVNNDPETIVKWPGQQSIESAADWIERRTRGPRIKIRKLINPNYEPQPEAARRPLLGAPNGTANGISRRSSNSDPDDADADEEDAYPFPPGYSTFYPSSSSPYSSQLPPHHSSLLLHASLGCFLAATILLFVSALLLATGRHKLRREVDAGVLTGASGAVVFLVLGMQCVVLRWDELGWVGKVGWAAGFLLLGGAGCAELLMVVRAGVL